MSFVAVDEVQAPVQAALNPIDMALAEWLRELIWTGWSTSPRSLQPELGMSEIGSTCERQMAYRLAGVPATNFDVDPMPSLTGTGIHLALAQIFTRLDGGTGRWLIEHRLDYAGIPGTVDAYDRRRKLLIDWKSTAKAKLRSIRAEGPPGTYVVQAQLYAAALIAAGEPVNRIAVVYLPRDGKLDDLTVWSTTPEQAVVDDHLQRYARISHEATRPEMTNVGASFTATPTRLCGWCAHYRPTSTDLAVACPGQTKGS